MKRACTASVSFAGRAMTVLLTAHGKPRGVPCAVQQSFRGYPKVARKGWYPMINSSSAQGWTLAVGFLALTSGFFVARGARRRGWYQFGGVMAHGGLDVLLKR